VDHYDLTNLKRSLFFIAMASTVRARFLFATEASADGKTTVCRLWQMQIEEQEEIYAFPTIYRDLNFHEELMKTTVAKNAKKVLTVRHAYRNPIIKLTDELRKIYLDEEGNPAFRGDLLEEINEPVKLPKSKPIIEREIDEVPVAKQKTLSSVAKDAVIERFNGRNFNASTWLNTLESECRRLEIPEHRYCEIIRLFIEGPATDWYLANRTILGTATWTIWRLSSLNAFSSKGWSDVCNALYFHFTSGSITDYALKKLSLLVDMDPKISENLKVCTIVAGLPVSVRERLDRDEIDSVNKLFSKLNLLDRPPRINGPNNFTSNNNNNNNNNFRYKGSSIRFNNNSFNRGGQQHRTPCTYCEKKGFPGRFHTESECRTKAYDNIKNGVPPNNNNNNNNSITYANAMKVGTAFNTKPVKLVNTTELEELIASEANQKN
jgi:hypothetical protein